MASITIVARKGEEPGGKPQLSSGCLQAFPRTTGEEASLNLTGTTLVRRVYLFMFYALLKHISFIQQQATLWWKETEQGQRVIQ